MAWLLLFIIHFAGAAQKTVGPSGTTTSGGNSRNLALIDK